jgi:hypothetical protein
MGRYYTGDIEGKFWFGVQGSDDASHFGGSETEIEDEETEDVVELFYEFTRKDLKEINQGIQTCVDTLESNLDPLDKYFGPGGEGEISYSPERLAKHLKFETWTDAKFRNIMEQYARLHLGKQIKECVERLGYCNFSTEL